MTESLSDKTPWICLTCCFFEGLENENRLEMLEEMLEEMVVEEMVVDVMADGEVTEIVRTFIQV